MFKGITFKMTSNEVSSTESLSFVSLEWFKNETGITLPSSNVKQIIAKANNPGTYTLKVTPFLFAVQSSDKNEAVEMLTDNAGKHYTLQMKATCKHADGTSKSWDYHQTDPLLKQFNIEDLTEGSEIRLWLKFEEDRTTLPTMRTGPDATPPVSAVPITPQETRQALATPTVPTVIFRLLDHEGHYGPASKDSIQAAWKPLSDLKDKPNGFTNLQVRFGLNAKPFILFRDSAILLEKGELSFLASSDARLKTFWTEKDSDDLTMTVGFDKSGELAEIFGLRPSPVTTADIYPLDFAAVWGDGSPFFDSKSFANSTRLLAEESKKAGILPFIIYLKPLLPLTPASIANGAPPAMSGASSSQASDAAKAASEMAETKRLEEAKKKAADEATMAAKQKEAEMAKSILEPLLREAALAKAKAETAMKTAEEAVEKANRAAAIAEAMRKEETAQKAATVSALMSQAAPAPKQLLRAVDPGAKDHGILIVLDNYSPWMRGNTRLSIMEGIEAALKRLPFGIKTNAVIAAGVLNQSYARFDLKTLTDENERYKVMLKLQNIQLNQYREQLHGTTPLEFGQILLGESPSDDEAENFRLRAILRMAKAWSVIFICPPLTSHSEVKHGEATGSTANSTSEPAQLNYALDELAKGREGKALLAETDIDMRFLILSPDVKAYTIAIPATVRIIEKTDPQPSTPIGDAISDFFK